MTGGTSTEPICWARVWATAHPFARPLPRAGAWYPVLGETSGDRAVLRIRGKRVAILKKLLEFRDERPRVFTVVIRPKEALADLAPFGAELARVYAVCPVCSQRVRIVDKQTMATCAGCGHDGEIAWWETG